MHHCGSHPTNLDFLAGPSFVEEIVVASKTCNDEYIVFETVVSGHRIRMECKYELVSCNSALHGQFAHIVHNEDDIGGT